MLNDIITTKYTKVKMYIFKLVLIILIAAKGREYIFTISLTQIRKGKILFEF